MRTSHVASSSQFLTVFLSPRPEIFAHLQCYGGWTGSYLPNFRGNFSFLSSRVKNCNIFLGLLTFKEGTFRLSRNIGKYSWQMTNVTHKFLSIYLFITLYMFRAHSAQHQERQFVSIQPLVILCWWSSCVHITRPPT